MTYTTTRDGIHVRAGAETIECSRGGNRMRYSGYSRAEAVREFRDEFPQQED